MSPVRSVLCSLGFYQGAKTGRCFYEKLRSSPYRLYRRYSDNRHIPGQGSESRGGFDRSIRGPGVHSEHAEVGIDSVPADQISGAAGGYAHYVSEPPRSQDQSDPGRGHSAPSTGQHQCSQVGTVYRETECCLPGSVPSPAVLSPPSEGPPWGPVQRQSELRIIAPAVSGISGRGSMVAAAPVPMEWSDLAETSSAVSDSIGCLPDGVGGCVQGSSDRGPWSPEEQQMHINCLELSAATLAVQAFAKDLSGIEILLQLDNQTAVAYINHLGGTVSLQLAKLAKTLWLWAFQRDIILSTQHIPGVTN